VERICEKVGFEPGVKSKGVMDDERRDDERDGLTNGCRRETARCFVSLNILLSRSRSLKVI